MPVCVCVHGWGGVGEICYLTVEYLLYSTTGTTTVLMDLRKAFIQGPRCCAKCCVIVHAAWCSIEERAPTHVPEECRFVHKSGALFRKGMDDWMDHWSCHAHIWWYNANMYRTSRPGGPSAQVCQALAQVGLHS